MLDSDIEKQQRIVKYETIQLEFLPVSQLQEKFNNDEPELKKRELEVMHMVLTGLSIDQIRLQIYLSRAGVKWRLGCVYQKFGVKNRLELINKAYKTGLQFICPNGTKQTFHLQFNARDHKLNEK